MSFVAPLHVPYARATRKQRTRGATCAALVMGLCLLSGCDDRIRQTVRQGAYDVFESGMTTFYGELTGAVTTGIHDLTDDSTAVDDTTSVDTAKDS